MNNNITAEDIKKNNINKSFLKLLSQSIHRTRNEPYGKDFACCNVHIMQDLTITPICTQCGNTRISKYHQFINDILNTK